MDKKIITLLTILIFSVACLSFVSADNGTADNMETAEIENNITNSKENSTDLTNYITAVHITDKGIEFSDGFTGFCIDSSKNSANVDDKFTAEGTKDEEMQNNVKLAIIECYKAGKENNIQNAVSQAINGAKKYDAESVLDSHGILDDTVTVKINNTTEATFTFELLKPVDGGRSDCLAYNVSLKKVAGDDVLAAGNDSVKNTTAENDTVKNADNNTKKNAAGNDDTNASDSKQVTANQTIIENNTLINNTNNTNNNVNNTTIIQNNTKVINKTNETPKNATLQQKLMRVVGNPITILVIVIVVIAIVGVAMKRRQ